ncbi:MAG: sulfurtransferase complex subunit TusD [Gammaproteobacteria bacterium]|jgi:tRNA 2-thiouridine synthesizing protein D|nr:sulfurtransferase complex subunit TusD [Gammaproteobacteria bacterium]|tara:strand:- start:47466 stop:47858 length:393 start_codon:yes stop_codon:yes gene_type:complete
MAAKKMKYSLIIYSDKADNGAISALSLAQAIIHSGHTLYRLFFYRDGVMLAKKNTGTSPSQQRAWQQFVSENHLDAVACVSAAVRRGLVSENESLSATSTFEHIAPSFQVSGLGQLADALANSDRVVSFG